MRVGVGVPSVSVATKTTIDVNFGLSRIWLSVCSNINPSGSQYEQISILFRSLSWADSRFAPSQWETSLQSNAVSHRLGANLESVLLSVFTAREHALNFRSIAFGGVMIELHFLCRNCYHSFGWYVVPCDSFSGLRLDTFLDDRLIFIMEISIQERRSL